MPRRLLKIIENILTKFPAKQHLDLASWFLYVVFSILYINYLYITDFITDIHFPRFGDNKLIQHVSEKTTPGLGVILREISSIFFNIIINTDLLLLNGRG